MSQRKRRLLFLFLAVGFVGIAGVLILTSDEVLVLRRGGNVDERIAKNNSRSSRQEKCSKYVCPFRKSRTSWHPGL
jgi:hypothetical protein